MARNHRASLAAARSAKWFIGLFLAVQVLAPLEYYCVRADANDERFAWRMFSPTRMLACTPTFTIGSEEQPEDLTQQFHEAWITIAKRGRLEIVERMGAALCARHPGQPVRAELICLTIDGHSEKRGGWNICAVDEL
jgi:hypothetical protein